MAYKVRSPAEIEEMQNKEIKKVQTLLEVPVSDIVSQSNVPDVDRCHSSSPLRVEL